MRAADEAYARFDVDGYVAHVAAAVRGYTAADQPCRAAMACVRLGDAYANALGNLTAGRAWFARAQRLVADQPDCLEQGWVAVAAMGCDVDDPAELLRAADLALDRARRFGDVNLEVKALADGGLALVQAGRLVEGMARLDEAMALACGPADDAETAAKSVCSFFTACYHAADFGKASSWADVLRRQGLIGTTEPGPVFLSSHCDSVQAALLMELGRWSEAEQVLERAKRAFEAVMQQPSWHPDLGLADLRVRQGRLAEAEALLLGRDQSMQALLPALRLHLARGDGELAVAAARRGLRAVGDDQLRGVELLTLLAGAELARGELDAARGVADALTRRAAGLEVPALRARAAAAVAAVHRAGGEADAAVAQLEWALDTLDLEQLPWLRATLLVDLVRVREEQHDLPGAALDAAAALALLGSLDVVVPPGDVELLARHARPGAAAPSGAAPPTVVSTSPAASPGGLEPAGGVPAPSAAVLRREGGAWIVEHEGTRARLTDTKGVRYLAELLATPGVERHALDLVDRVEGHVVDGPDRRTLGDAGPQLDGAARNAYRRRVEDLRAAADDALEEGRLDDAEAAQAELDALVAELARAFGLGGRDRKAASAAERARLNVTRAVRTAVARIAEVVPAAGAALDRRVRTGTYCAYEPQPADAVRWSAAPAPSRAGG